VSQFGGVLLPELAHAIGVVFPYAVAVTMFAIILLMVKRWLGHHPATRLDTRSQEEISRDHDRMGF
jgi:hypothetical protein